MTERPILFQGAMVRALLAGTKTQTRRIIKPAPQMVTDKAIAKWEGDPSALMRLQELVGRPCPFGMPGARLWVRESWAYNPDFPGIDSRACFKADPEHAHEGLKWKPSIHMRRSACRLVLEVTGVRVERLQNISEADARTEGIVQRRIGTGDHRTGMRDAFGLADNDNAYATSAVQAYADLWDSINGAGSWEVNPWVWVVEFKRVKP